ncbi:MAG TPA: hypothetical protein VK986_01705, partial [Tepidisphaeraceae bacterium]|nr:hypothetical protein [Tepidisphaeraceae bacterium]
MSTITSTTTPVEHEHATGTSGGDAARGRRRGKLLTVVVLVAALVGASLTQDAAHAYRVAAINRNQPRGAAQSTADASRAASLDSFALSLMLGGLRGPLVMYLWTSSESQKSERELDSFDTQIELIRLL